MIYSRQTAVLEVKKAKKNQASESNKEAQNGYHLSRRDCKYGRMRRSYLREHRPILFGLMVQNGTLFDHLIETEDAAQSRLEAIVPALAKAAGATEALKAADQMKWVGIMNACKAQAEEVIFQEIIFA